MSYLTFIDYFLLCRNDNTVFSQDVSRVSKGLRKYSGLVSDGLLSFYELFSVM